MPSSSGPRIRGFATPDQLGLHEPPLRAWSDSMRPMPASTAQLSRQLGAAFFSTLAALLYAARASRGMVPEPDHAGRAGDNVGAAFVGTPTDAGCLLAAGTSQSAGAMTTLGVASADAGEEGGAGYVTCVSIGAAAFATAGRRGKPPEVWASTNAAAKKAIAAAALHACARGRVRRRPPWRASITLLWCFEVLACCATRACRAVATGCAGSGARRICGTRACLAPVLRCASRACCARRA